MSQKLPYTVTERAGPRVAGMRLKPGDEISLSPAEAEHELREGTIVKKGAKLAAAFSTDSPKLQALRRVAKGQEEAAPVSAPAAPAAETAETEAASKPARKLAKE